MKIAHVLVAVAALVLSACAWGRKEEPPGACHIGAYRLTDGTLVDIGAAEDGLRWRTMDGRTGKLTPDADGWKSTLGWTERPDGVAVAFGACSEGRIQFARQPGSRVPLAVHETTFTGDGGVKLAGRLVMPQGTGPVPVVVMVHGSEDTSARRNYFDQRMRPAQGIGVFVYDKRGTGDSLGKYTQDFHVLSRDGAAAVAEARRLAAGRIARLGVEGGSQGGWIAPLVAILTPVDFVIAKYGMAEGPLAENRGEVLRGLQDKGYGPDVLAKAAEVADATGEVMASDFRGGWAELAAVRRKYGKEPWFKDVEGEFSADVLKYPEPLLRIGGRFFDKGTSWEYDPMPTLRRVDAPMLWILAGDDLEAPVDETRRRLLALARAGRPITVLEFAEADHGIRLFEVGAAGERTGLRYAEGYFQALVDFSRTSSLPAQYGDALRLSDMPAPQS